VDSRAWANGKVVGTFTGNTLFKRLDERKHFLRHPPAIAYDAEVIEEAYEREVEYLVVEEIAQGELYTAKIDLIYEFGFEVNRGHGEQIALPLQYWNVYRNMTFKKYVKQQRYKN
jgi:hypothetical protein